MTLTRRRVSPNDPNSDFVSFSDADPFEGAMGGEPGPPGADGCTPVKGVDYFDGDPGLPGNPGPMPTVSGTGWAHATNGAWDSAASTPSAADVGAAATNDARLSDARTPTTHGHAPGDVTGTAVVTNDARLSDARTPTTHAHGEYAASGDLTTHANLTSAAHGGIPATPPTDPVAGTAGLRTLGTGAQQAAVGSHSHGAGADVPEPWEGKLVVARGDGNPCLDDVLWAFQNTVASVAGPTPTGIGAAIGRLVGFRLKSAITVNNVRYFGLGTVSNLHTMALYNGTARVWMADPCQVVAGWQAVNIGGGLVIAANTWYWLGLGAKSTGTTAGFRTPASCIANSFGIAAPPGNIGIYGPRYAQVALTAGAWPTTLPTITAAAFASAGTTGTVPAVFLDNA